jgi:hypothetical protein
MATSAQVLNMLIPTGGYAIYGDDFEGIQFIEATPITKEQFEAGFAEYDAWKAEQDATKAAAKQALLDKLGITAEEAQLALLKEEAARIKSENDNQAARMEAEIAILQSHISVLRA